MNWSKQQREFLDWCLSSTGSCILVAVAGAGKTTVLIEAGRIIQGCVAYMAYNKDIVKETTAKLEKLGISWQKMNAKTAHSFGLGAYRKTRPNVIVAEHKMLNIIDMMIKEEDALAIHKPAIAQLCSLAKQRVFGLLVPMKSFDEWALMADHFDVFDEESGPVPMEEIIEKCIQAMQTSIQQMDIVDFDDMIYMPLIHKVRFWQYDVVMVDEAQDTNPARRALVRAMVKKGGRVIAVGDPHQAIYGFTGADSDALDLIQKDFNAVRLNLTVSFRCPKAVIKFAQNWVSHIEAAETAPEGVPVVRTKMEDFLKRNDLKAGTSVLCRVNKPLVSLAFTCIRNRIPCRIEGRDVANALKKLMTRWKVSSLDALEGKLDSYLARETTKLLAKKQEAKLQNVEDAVETIRVIIDQCRVEGKRSIADATDYVDQLFGDQVSGVMVLSSIHKSKGREWPNVFWLDRANTCPSKWARQAWQQEQEKNLCYVAATRAKEALIELDAPIKKAA